MARSTIGLTDTAVRQLKPKDKDYVKSDGKAVFFKIVDTFLSFKRPVFHPA